MNTTPLATLEAERAAHLAAKITGRCFTKALRAWEAELARIDRAIARAKRAAV